MAYKCILSWTSGPSHFPLEGELRLMEGGVKIEGAKVTREGTVRLREKQEGERESIESEREREQLYCAIHCTHNPGREMQTMPNLVTKEVSVSQ